MTSKHFHNPEVSMKSHGGLLLATSVAISDVSDIFHVTLSLTIYLCFRAALWCHHNFFQSYSFTKLQLEAAVPKSENCSNPRYINSCGMSAKEPAIIWLAPWTGKMNQILRCDWLPTTRRVPWEKFLRNPYNRTFVDQACSVNMAGYWPRSFLRAYRPRFRVGP